MRTPFAFLTKLLGAAALLTALPLAQAQAPTAPKVLRYAFQIAETGFDPAQISDDYSRTITPHIFEALYAFDYLALPVKAKPLTAAALPEVTNDFKTWTIRLKPGIYFADDPAFKGKKRELTAQDYVYSFKRFADPKINAPLYAGVEELGIQGLLALRNKAIAEKRALDYDAPIAGLRALDRYTLQINLDQARPRLLDNLASNDLMGAVAREVVEFYGERISEHPVGTGPFVLKQWRRSSLIVLEKNPGYRERFFEAEPAADDAEGQAILTRFKGRHIPMIDRVEISIIEESQPRWLSFLNGEADLSFIVPNEFVNSALPGNKLAPNLAKRGMRLHRILAADEAFTFFNMEDPTVGGYTPDKVALRRAISLGLDVEREIRQVRRGQAVLAQSHVVPHTSGYDPKYRSEMSTYDPARAAALLDAYGYVDRDGDGWRDMPDGSPLLLEVATQPDSQSRQYDELWQRSFDALHIRVKFFAGKWPEQMKSARAGKLMLWMMGNTANSPDGLETLQYLYGPQAGNQNISRFRLKEFDELYERMLVMPDGPEREALLLKAKRIQAAYLPIKTHVHRIRSDISQPWLIGYRRPMFRNEFWHFVDIDNGLRP
ncbi:ABC-type transport system substrate-binding protein [Paucibacter oligotrophus]|uniref:ABC-type transport system substrate-binding protein n=1 Tax=Roseateles oligotrophus TaxID=1769250 RepID=A0A840LB18_9BURK|nr:ABC transporter substrate-binding protein [Roseateles oligotrophus]MBB4842547.1 ABC-type transport system substrate-binding protein [Roseateles oligotrophus]